MRVRVRVGFRGRLRVGFRVRVRVRARVELGPMLLPWSTSFLSGSSWPSPGWG